MSVAANKILIFKLCSAMAEFKHLTVIMISHCT